VGVGYDLCRLVVIMRGFDERPRRREIKECFLATFFYGIRTRERGLFNEHFHKIDPNEIHGAAWFALGGTLIFLAKRDPLKPSTKRPQL